MIYKYCKNQLSLLSIIQMSECLTSLEIEDALKKILSINCGAEMAVCNATINTDTESSKLVEYDSSQSNQTSENDFSGLKINEIPSQKVTMTEIQGLEQSPLNFGNKSLFIGDQVNESYRSVPAAQSQETLSETGSEKKKKKERKDRKERKEVRRKKQMEVSQMQPMTFTESQHPANTADLSGVYLEKTRDIGLDKLHSVSANTTGAFTSKVLENSSTKQASSRQPNKSAKFPNIVSKDDFLNIDFSIFRDVMGVDFESSDPFVFTAKTGTASGNASLGNNTTVKEAPKPKKNDSTQKKQENLNATDCSFNPPVGQEALSERDQNSEKSSDANQATVRSIDSELEDQGLFPLKKKSTKFPNAKYFCRLCEYHCSDVEHCMKHMKDLRHIRLLTIRNEEELLKGIGMPGGQHAEAVTQSVINLCSKFAIGNVELKARAKVLKKIKFLVNSISKDASVEMYGSTVSQFALKDSDLNVNLTDDQPAKLMLALYDMMLKDKTGYFVGIEKNFSCKVPCISAYIPSAKLRLQVVVNCGSCVRTSQLLAVYSQIDPRVKMLAATFRYWAKICKIDRQDEGSLPAYVFSLLTVYYLQQCQPPVLPVLHELLPIEEKVNGDGTDYLSDIKKVSLIWKCENTQSIGCLWVDMLRFYTIDLNMAETIICIRESKPLTRNEKKWSSRKLAIEDPFSSKRNVARSLSHGQVFEYINERLRVAYKYFGRLPSDEPFDFPFSEQILSTAKGPIMMCGICQQQGHLKDSCPDDCLPPPRPLPPMSGPFLHKLNEVIYQVHADFRPNDREIRERERLRGELEAIVKELYPGARLTLFGSSCNGFGFQHSDLDISLTFDSHPTSENLNCPEIIETLAKKLKKNRTFYNICPITTAKVPIVKFKHSRTNFEGDISLYNTLARHNTRMLWTYSEIDPRVCHLGYAMKVLAKSCDICDASKGSLSSYAYTLMVLYFLQQTNPPVIPVLQELYREKKPEVLVDGWNAWFYEDLQNLDKVWPGRGRNRDSSAELWIKLLRFYTEEFDFRDVVISIRQRPIITKFEKLWNSSGYAVEDPFNLDHNLGSGLSRKMNIYIRKVFLRARERFGRPISSMPRNYQTMTDYFFDVYKLTDSGPPNDRGCRRCGKIGHFVAECPLGNKGKAQQREDAEAEDDRLSDSIQPIPVLDPFKESQGDAGWRQTSKPSPQSLQPSKSTVPASVGGSRSTSQLAGQALQQQPLDSMVFLNRNMPQIYPAPMSGGNPLQVVNPHQLQMMGQTGVIPLMSPALLNQAGVSPYHFYPQVSFVGSNHFSSSLAAQPLAAVPDLKVRQTQAQSAVVRPPPGIPAKTTAVPMPMPQVYHSIHGIRLQGPQMTFQTTQTSQMAQASQMAKTSQMAQASQMSQVPQMAQTSQMAPASQMAQASHLAQPNLMPQAAPAALAAHMGRQASLHDQDLRSTNQMPDARLEPDKDQSHKQQTSVEHSKVVGFEKSTRSNKDSECKSGLPLRFPTPNLFPFPMVVMPSTNFPQHPLMLSQSLGQPLVFQDQGLHIGSSIPLAINSSSTTKDGCQVAATTAFSTGGSATVFPDGSSLSHVVSAASDRPVGSPSNSSQLSSDGPDQFQKLVNLD